MKSSFGIIDQIIRSWAIVKKDIKVYYAKGPVVLSGVLWPAIMFISFAFGRNVPAKSLMPGLISVSVFFTCSAIAPITFPWESANRTLERLISCPIAVWTILLGDMLASAITGVIISIIPIVIALAVGATILNPIVLTVAIILGSICFATASLLISAPPTTTPQVTQMLGTIIKFPLMFLSGVFVPLSELPAFARSLAFISPLTYFTDLTRYATGGENYFSIFVDLWAIIGFTVVAWVVAVKLHNRTLPMRV
ncbi:MAG: ABC transporter permease [Dehalococcoidales bacterium]|nr:ABC transporter permease [Dehalococcoidales bacterium]